MVSEPWVSVEDVAAHLGGGAQTGGSRDVVCQLTNRPPMEVQALEVDDRRRDGAVDDDDEQEPRRAKPGERSPTKTTRKS